LLNIELAGYAAFPGLLALALSLIIAPEIYRLLGSGIPVLLSRFRSESLLPVSFLFLTILFLLEPGYAAIAFPAGVFSTILFLVYSFAVRRAADGSSSHQIEPIMGWSFCLAAGGLALASIGVYTAVFAWENIFVVNIFVFGAAAVQLFISIGGFSGRESEKESGIVISSADFYLSFLCILAAAITMGALITEHRRVWIGLPVLFGMVGLTALFMIAPLMRAMNRHLLWIEISIRFIAVSFIIVFLYIITGDGTGKISSDAIAYQGFFDRMGPFWAWMAGAFTGTILVILTRNSGVASGMTIDNFTLGFSLYFMAVCLWISFVLADFYGIALAGTGFFMAVCVLSGHLMIPAAGSDAGKAFGISTGVSIFSTLAVAASCLMQIGDSADLGFGVDGLAWASVVAGLLTGAGMAYVMMLFIQRKLMVAYPGIGFHFPFMSPENTFGLAFISVPIFVGLVAGLEMLFGLIAGVILVGALYGVMRMEREEGPIAAGRLNGLVRMSLLAILAAASIIGL